MEHQHGYPAARPRCRGAAAAVATKFRRVQSSGGFVTLGDSNADVLVFSGEPDRVEVFVELNDAILTFGRTTAEEEAEVTIRAGVHFEPGIGCRRVIGRNAVAGFTARVQVVGKWAEEA